MTGARVRVLMAAAVVLAALLFGLLLDSLGATQILFWMNSPALALALALGGNVHGAGTPAIYFTFPLQWFLVGYGLSFLILPRGAREASA